MKKIIKIEWDGDRKKVTYEDDSYSIETPNSFSICNPKLFKPLSDKVWADYVEDSKVKEGVK